MRTVSGRGSHGATPNTSTLNSRDITFGTHNTSTSSGSHTLDPARDGEAMRLEAADVHDDSSQSGSRSINSPKKDRDRDFGHGHRSGSEEWNHEERDRGNHITQDHKGGADDFNYSYYKISYDGSCPAADQNANDNDDNVSQDSYHLSENLADTPEPLDAVLHIDEEKLIRELEKEKERAEREEEERIDRLGIREYVEEAERREREAGGVIEQPEEPGEGDIILTKISNGEVVRDVHNGVDNINEDDKGNNYDSLRSERSVKTTDSGMKTPDSGMKTPDSGLKTPDSGWVTPDSDADDIPYILHRRQVRGSKTPPTRRVQKSPQPPKRVSSLPRPKLTKEQETVEFNNIKMNITSPIVPTAKISRDKSPRRPVDYVAFSKLPPADSYSCRDDSLSPTMEKDIISQIQHKHEETMRGRKSNKEEEGRGRKMEKKNGNGKVERKFESLPTSLSPTEVVIDPSKYTMEGIKDTVAKTEEYYVQCSPVEPPPPPENIGEEVIDVEPDLPEPPEICKSEEFSLQAGEEMPEPMKTEDYYVQCDPVDDIPPILEPVEPSVIPEADLQPVEVPENELQSEYFVEVTHIEAEHSHIELTPICSMSALEEDPDLVEIELRSPTHGPGLTPSGLARIQEEPHSDAESVTKETEKKVLLPPKAVMEDLTTTESDSSAESDRDTKGKAAAQMKQQDSSGSDSSTSTPRPGSQEREQFRLSQQDIPFADEAPPSPPQERKLILPPDLDDSIEEEDEADVKTPVAPVPPPLPDTSPPRDPSPPLPPPPVEVTIESPSEACTSSDEFEKTIEEQLTAVGGEEVEDFSDELISEALDQPAPEHPGSDSTVFDTDSQPSIPPVLHDISSEDEVEHPTDEDFVDFDQFERRLDFHLEEGDELIECLPESPTEPSSKEFPPLPPPPLHDISSESDVELPQDEIQDMEGFERQFEMNLEEEEDSLQLLADNDQVLSDGDSSLNISKADADSFVSSSDDGDRMHPERLPLPQVPHHDISSEDSDQSEPYMGEDLLDPTEILEASVFANPYMERSPSEDFGPPPPPPPIPGEIPQEYYIDLSGRNAAPSQVHYGSLPGVELSDDSSSADEIPPTADDTEDMLDPLERLEQRIRSGSPDSDSDSSSSDDFEELPVGVRQRHMQRHNVPMVPRTEGDVQVIDDPVVRLQAQNQGQVFSNPYASIGRSQGQARSSSRSNPYATLDRSQSEAGRSSRSNPYATLDRSQSEAGRSSRSNPYASLDRSTQGQAGSSSENNPYATLDRSQGQAGRSSRSPPSGGKPPRS